MAELGEITYALDKARELNLHIFFGADEVYDKGGFGVPYADEPTTADAFCALVALCSELHDKTHVAKGQA